MFNEDWNVEKKLWDLFSCPFMFLKVNLPANSGDMSLIPGSGTSPGEGNGNLLQYSCLENLLDGGAWWSTVHGVPKSQRQLSTHRAAAATRTKSLYSSLYSFMFEIVHNIKPFQKLNEAQSIVYEYMTFIEHWKYLRPYSIHWGKAKEAIILVRMLIT